MIEQTDIDAALADGAAIIATVVNAVGSTPADAGASMVITTSSSRGTVGGGTAEHQTINAARQMLSSVERERLLSFPLGPDLDQCCGGRLEVRLRRIEPGEDPEAIASPDRQPVIIYGAGHVGLAVANALQPLFHVTLVGAGHEDPRDWPAHHTVISPLPEAEANQASPNAMHLIMTHSHAVDLEIVSAVLSGPERYCGLIGSATKRATFARRLSERGFGDADIGRLICPIGLPGLKDKRPSAIAASVAADLLIRSKEGWR